MPRPKKYLTPDEAHAAALERQREYRLRVKSRPLPSARPDVFAVTSAGLRSAAAECVRERPRDAAAINRLLLALNLEPVGRDNEERAAPVMVTL